ncbi:MAG: hypothetical protein HYY01_10395 [Chloroflexi bacterium]|nr:hypothetical protein [Chloroflexota bacterium]
MAFFEEPDVLVEGEPAGKAADAGATQVVFVRLVHGAHARSLKATGS